MKAAPAPETPGVLPLPKAAADHHAQVLGGPMKEWQTQRRVPPVLLLTGIPGVGKRSMAYYLAQWLLCERTGLNQVVSEDSGGDLFGGLLGEAPKPAAPVGDEPRPCGECMSCQRAIRGTWIDFVEVLPEEEGESLKIEQFRKLKTQLGFGAHEGNYRVILIPNADRMTVQAANSVLKLLEEPPAGWIFFLTASDSNLLLPTLVSRCQTIRLKPFTKATLEELLGDVRGGKQALCAELGQGSWGKALEWTEEESWKNRDTLLTFLREPQAAIGPLVDWASQDTREFTRMIDQLESLTMDLIRWTLEEAPPEKHSWMNSDAKAALASHARARGTQSRAFWIERAERLARVRQELGAPLNRKLLAQDLLLPWL